MATIVQPAQNAPVILAPQPTGRRLVVFRDNVSSSDAAAVLRKVSGQTVVSAAEVGSVGASLRASGASDSIVLLDRFPVAAVGGGLERATSIASALGAEGIVADTRPEFWMFAAGGPPWEDDAHTTWGVDAVGSAASAFDGSGIRVAVLDTGIDLGHPDFAGRAIVTESFVAGETIDDVQGHGTHVAGTAVGRRPGSANLPRYGVASGADLYVGKVLNNQGAGRELDIIAGIEWAVDKECAVVCMSLSRPVSPHESHDPFYELVARTALEAGTLLIAAAGNDSDRRYNYVAPVGSPANAPSILAVAAIGADGGVATISSGATGVDDVDVCAPGVQVLSCVPRPQLYASMSGTSMACPHAVGVAALLAQSDPALRGQALADALRKSVVPLGSPRDYGAGLVQAP